MGHPSGGLDDAPEWGRAYFEELREHRREFRAFMKEAAEDRRQTADDRRQAAADRSEFRAELRQSHRNFLAVVKGIRGEAAAIRKILLDHTKLLHDIRGAVRARGNGQSGNGK